MTLLPRGRLPRTVAAPVSGLADAIPRALLLANAAGLRAGPPGLPLIPYAINWNAGDEFHSHIDNSDSVKLTWVTNYFQSSGRISPLVLLSLCLPLYFILPSLAHPTGTFVRLFNSDCHLPTILIESGIAH